MLWDAQFHEGNFYLVTREEIKELLNEAEKKFVSESKLIQLESGKIIFVGDTHGDLEATEKIINRYLKPRNKLVFLGDYVDRGPASLDNINFLLWFSWGTMLTEDQLLWITLTFCLGEKLSTPTLFICLWETMKAMLYSVSSPPISGKGWIPNFDSDIVRSFLSCHLSCPRQMESLLCMEHYPMCPV